MAVYGAAAARVIRKPYVITMHGAEHHTRAWRRRVALRWAFGKSRATVAVSDDTRKHLETVLRLPHGSVTTVRNGIPVRPGSPDRVRAELGMQPGELLVVAVGNLVVRKGHRVLLEALHQLSANGTGCWRLAVAGRGRLKESLQQLAAEQGIGDRVHFLGHRDDVPDLLAAADIFAMPSLWEGLPLAVLESMFAGKPIVASAVSGIPEAVTSGEEGLLTAPGDTEALAAALRQLLEDSALRDRLGRAARARAEAEFTVARMGDQYERLYADKPTHG
jgi:glycosyltransferase involved in cell wall biosynthesis